MSMSAMLVYGRGQMFGGKCPRFSARWERADERDLLSSWQRSLTAAIHNAPRNVSTSATWPDVTRTPVATVGPPSSLHHKPVNRRRLTHPNTMHTTAGEQWELEENAWQSRAYKARPVFCWTCQPAAALDELFTLAAKTIYFSTNVTRVTRTGRQWGINFYWLAAAKLHCVGRLMLG